jgi:hypothetical protein
MSPGRPLLILLFGLIPCFAVIYICALGSRGRGALWAIWAADRVEKEVGDSEPVRLTTEAPFPHHTLPDEADTEPASCNALCTRQVTGSCELCNVLAERRRFCLYFTPKVILAALYFSVLSAFSIGWRELNVGNWISRIQSYEYNLRATGWVRTVSGLQSLLSVYLLALWALTYFGRPFE